jgi:2-C-methyl-D-erythritol 4-phosphate cytidylyltransferase/2-C-methyl-D-erythritol 2,4-cyclodiphosphate synthase
MFVSAIIAAGGRGARVGADRPKQFLDLAGATILDRSIDAFLQHAVIDEVIVALPAEHVAGLSARYAGRAEGRLTCVAGGSRRQDSVAAAFAATDPAADIVVIHDAARPFVSATLIDRTVDAAREHGAAIASLPARDTVKQAAGRRDEPTRPVAATLPREDIYLAQTPQAFRRDILARALDEGRDIEATDEAMLAERSGAVVHLVEGDPANVKITTMDDLERARHSRATGEPVRSAGASAPAYRIGTGYDLHRLVDGRRLILGGVTIPFAKGLDGHSDADMVCHAVTDAVLGAAGAGDIGRLFPDTDPQWKDADSVQLLKGAVARVRASGYLVGNVDVTVIAEQPKLLPFLDAIRASLADALQVDPAAVSVKGKTNEGMDSMGRGESMACHAVALVVRQ